MTKYHHACYRNLEEHECPLLLCLAWARDGLLRLFTRRANINSNVEEQNAFRRKKLVLADHVPGTQDYSGMSFEGLRAALQILSEVVTAPPLSSVSLSVTCDISRVMIAIQEEEAAVKAVQHKFSELKEVQN